ncbi:hypothetical protein Cgig2_006988 [Carnegiea gigantea]|uniref:Uncharacterized protein n=1 Tax=Carnegiea gigantea TaxID=171969 RepID=A0A9Q1KDY5_9CARY|nr:hypothetical protein Cgig2_006988 [Carnegiea gigantea]
MMNSASFEFSAACLAMNSSLALASFSPPQLTLGKISIRSLCSLVLDFEPNNMKALFRRAKATFGLHSFHHALCDLRKADHIEPNNLEITKEHVKAKSVNCQVGTSNKDLKESKHAGSCLRDWSCIESISKCLEGSNIQCRELDIAPKGQMLHVGCLGDESIITSILEVPCREANLVATPITEEVRRESSSNSMVATSDDCHVSSERGLHTVYVGKSLRRYQVSSEVLHHPVIQELVCRSDGCDDETTVISCEVVLFEHLLWMIQNSDPKSEPLDDLVGFYAY